MPSDMKNELWMAQFLFYMKKSAVQLLDSKTMNEYRRVSRLQIDENTYKQLIDPIVAGDKSSGKAEYFASDWKANPIAVHLDNIVKEGMDRIGFENKIQLSEIDKYAKSQKQKDKDKIIFQREFRNLINEVQKELGIPPIKDSQTPYDYTKSLSADKEKGDKAIDSVDSLIDYIRSQIKDSHDLTLYETYIYKGDIERAFELGVEHYLINMNKWRIKSEAFNDDLLNFNRACGRWYIDETSGRGTVEYFNPDELYTSPFSEKNGEDIVYWFRESDITFAEFVRQFGQTLDENSLKEIFELNKHSYGRHGMDWKGAKSAKGSNAKIRVGFGSALSQDADNFAERYVNNKIPILHPKPLSWLPDKFTPNKYKSGRVTKMYNVWYSFYYVPPPEGKLSNNTAIDWSWQAKYIFNMRKDIDMYRYGPDMRYAKSSLVVWRDLSRPSFRDIEEAFMPKIHTAWHKFQNCLINDLDAVLLAKEFLSAMIQSVDDANKDKETAAGKEAAVATIKMMKQSGNAFVNMLDRQGNPLPIDPVKFVVPVKNGLLEKGEKYLNIIVQLYQMLTMSLAQNDVSEGQDAKPRTPVAGIQASMASSQKGVWFVHKPAREFIIMFAERCVQHILCIVKEKRRYGFDKRWEEFKNVVGLAHALMVEGIEDMQPEELGLTVNLEDTRQYEKYIVELANKMADDGEVGRDVVGLVINQAGVNWKYAYVLLMIAAKQRQVEQAHKEEVEFQRALEIEKQKQQTAMLEIKAKGMAKDQNIQTQGTVDEKLNQQQGQQKHQSQAELKDKMKQNRIEQDNNKSELDRNKEREAKMMV